MPLPVDQAHHRGRGRLRLHLATASIASLSLVLAACGGSGGSSGAGAESAGGTLTVQAQTLQIPTFQAVADAFEAQHAGVTVEVQTLTDDQKNTTNAQILASDNPPDVGIVPINATPYTQLTKAKQLLPLDDVWQAADLQKRYGPAADSLKTGGTPYLAQFDSVLYNIIYVNEDAFAKAGVTVPEDHRLASNDELYSAVSKLKAAGYEGLSIGGGTSNGYKYGWLLDAQLAANADPAALENLNTSWQPGSTQSVRYTDPAFTGSLQQLQDWQDNGVFPNGHVATTDEQSLADFVAGKTGMYISHNLAVGDLDKAKPKFGYDWMLMPSATPGTSTLPTTYSGNTFAVPKNSDNAELAKQFIGFYLSDEMQAKQAELAGQLPAVNTVTTDKLNSLPELVRDVVSFAADNGTGAGWTSVTPGPLGQAFIGPEMQKQLNGEQAVGETAQATQENYEKFVAANS